MEPVLTAAEAADLDARTIHGLGMPGPVLMESAGRACWRILREWQPGATRIAVLCGPGNNGGDGFVVARYAQDAGLRVRCCLLGTKDKVSGDAALNLRLAEAVGVRIEPLTVDCVEGSEVVVDALFGTGLGRPVDGLAGAVVQAANALPVLAVDIPSGIHGTTGHVLGMAIRARHTVTFGTLKLGHVLYPGADHCGRLTVADIGFPGVVLRQVAGGAWLITADLVAEWVPRRETWANKGSAGRVVTIGGSAHYSGAPVMTSEAALRIGAGLSTVAVPRQAWQAVAARVHEVIVAPLADEGDGILGNEAHAAARDLLRTARAAAFGPGLGRHPHSLTLVADLLQEFSGPVVVDADGLGALHAGVPPRGGGVITPHPGEMATLMGLTTEEVVSDPVRIAREAARRFGLVTVLKGAHTVVAHVDGQVFLNTTGNSGMASGGMGDVLTGVVVGLLAQGASPLQAAVCGVHLHGLAGDLAAGEVGGRGLVATDVSARLPRALARVLGGDPGLETYFGRVC